MTALRETDIFARSSVETSGGSLVGREPKMWWVGWTFAKIQILELTRRAARQLIEETLDRNVVDVRDREHFVRELVRLANGNPRIITRICEMAGASRYKIGGRTDLRLLLLDLKLRDLQERIDAESQIPLRGPIQLSTSYGSCADRHHTSHETHEIGRNVGSGRLSQFPLSCVPTSPGPLEPHLYFGSGSGRRPRPNHSPVLFIQKEGEEASNGHAR